MRDKALEQHSYFTGQTGVYNYRQEDKFKPIGDNASKVQKSVYKPFHLLTASHLHKAPRPCRHTLVPQLANEAIQMEQHVMTESQLIKTQVDELTKLQSAV